MFLVNFVYEQMNKKSATTMSLSIQDTVLFFKNKCKSTRKLFIFAKYNIIINSFKNRRFVEYIRILYVISYNI